MAESKAPGSDPPLDEGEDEIRVEAIEGEDEEDLNVSDGDEAAEPEGSARPKIAKEDVDPAVMEQKYQAARALAREGKHEEAVDIFNDVLEMRTAYFGTNAPQVADCFYRLGLSYLQLAKTAADNFYSSMVKKKLTKEEPPARAHGRMHFGDEESSDSAAEGEATSEELLESAWQALEYARVIFEDHQATHLLQLSDVHLALGDFALEAEQPQEQTLAEYATVLRLRQQLPEQLEGTAAAPAGSPAPSRDRLLAEAEYELGLVHLTLGMNSEAKPHLEAAVTFLEKRKAALPPVAQAPALDKTEKTEAASGPVSEAEELASLIEDINAKIEDIAAAAAEEAKKTAAIFAAANPQNLLPRPKPAAAGPTHTLNSLVRPNPKAETVKRKAADPPAPTAASPAADGAEGQGKRQKAEEPKPHSG